MPLVESPYYTWREAVEQVANACPGEDPIDNLIGAFAAVTGQFSDEVKLAAEVLGEDGNYEPILATLWVLVQEDREHSKPSQGLNVLTDEGEHKCHTKPSYDDIALWTHCRRGPDISEWQINLFHGKAEFYAYHGDGDGYHTRGSIYVKKEALDGLLNRQKNSSKRENAPVGRPKKFDREKLVWPIFDEWLEQIGGAPKLKNYKNRDIADTFMRRIKKDARWEGQEFPSYSTVRVHWVKYWLKARRLKP